MKDLSKQVEELLNNTISTFNESTMKALKMKRKKQYVFIDIETTGVDTYEDYILEVACIITNDQFEIIEEKEWVIKRDAELMKMISDEWVINAHTKTGLWDKLENGLSQEQVDEELFEMIRRAQPEYKVSIWGDSVHFDMNFLSYHFEKTGEILSHRVVDLTSVLLCFKANEKEVETPEHESSHNALDDIRFSVVKAQTIKEYLK